MTIDTSVIGIYTYFLIILSGFGVVWSYRKASKTHKQISDFEYACFSALWGVIIFGLYGWLMRNKLEEAFKLLVNPFASGVVLFGLGATVGGTLGWFKKLIFSNFR